MKPLLLCKPIRRAGFVQVYPAQLVASIIACVCNASPISRLAEQGRVERRAAPPALPSSPRTVKRGESLL